MDAATTVPPQLGFLQVLFAGEAPCHETTSDAAHDLLALGFIKETERDAEDGHLKKVFVMAAPLLATVMLKTWLWKCLVRLSLRRQEPNWT